VPRGKKSPGTAVDKRNGQQLNLRAAAPLKPFSLPRRSDGKPWQPEVRKAWTALRRDPVWQLLSVVDRPVLLRWAGALHRAEVAYELADAEPITQGSQGQDVANPLFAVAEGQLKIAQACEAQLGVGALHRARLNIDSTAAARSLVDLSQAIEDGDDDDDEPDPRDEPDPQLP
jgi:hypothetical protein